MSSSASHKSNLIPDLLGKLLLLIDKLPYSPEIRMYLKYNVATDFYDSIQFDDDANTISYDYFYNYSDENDSLDALTTIGIVKPRQAYRYVSEFLDRVRHIPKSIVKDEFFQDAFTNSTIPVMPDLTIRDLTKPEFLDIYKQEKISKNELHEYLSAFLGDIYEDIRHKITKPQISGKPCQAYMNQVILAKALINMPLEQEFDLLLCVYFAEMFYEKTKSGLKIDNNFPLSSPFFFESLVPQECFDYSISLRFRYLNIFEAFRFLYKSIKQLKLRNFETFHQEIIRTPYRIKHFFPSNGHDDSLFLYACSLFESLCADSYNNSIIIDICEKVLKKLQADHPQLHEAFLTTYNKQTYQFIKPLQGFADRSITEIILDQPSFFEDIIPEPEKQQAFTIKNYYIDDLAFADAFNTLVKHDFIHPDTDEKTFAGIFQNKMPNPKIKWIGTLSDLVFFVKQLHNDYKIIDNLGKRIWKVTDKLFVDESGNSFGSKRYSGQKPPANTAYLIKAADHLKDMAYTGPF